MLAVRVCASGWAALFFVGLICAAGAGGANRRPPVVDLDACRPGPRCDYGPIYARYPTYGNVAPQLLGDCTFAAVADWEQIVLHKHPNPKRIEREFRKAGGKAERGVSLEELFFTWAATGIGGSIMTDARTLSTGPVRVERAIRRYKALLVEFNFDYGDEFGPFFAPSGAHMAVVDGFTPAGPLVVTWGQTIQMTWEDWVIEADAVWRITAT